MEPKGKIFLIGGAEERAGNMQPERSKECSSRYEILGQLLPSKKMNGRIEVITCASGVPKDIARTYERTFGEIGYANVGFLHADRRSEVSAQDWSQRIGDAEVVFLTGGDQAKLAAILGGSRPWGTIEEKYREDKGFTVAGTSAGAMVLSSTMIMGGGSSDSHIETPIRLGPGLGIVDHCVVDTHFVERGRFVRLARSLLLNPRYLGLGLGEDSAVVIEGGIKATCIGNGMVVVIDCSGVTQTNSEEIDAVNSIYARDIQVHLLIKGCSIDLTERGPNFSNGR
ncbi:cyanophycinase [Sphingobacterium sp.]|uniref:cyanophycinase n=1 Tax=Sphingobacterium sp. TaxID=341027 RepID=UPI0028AF0A87|nr:cyanophycinase [Sphingobacterium sp.]